MRSSACDTLIRFCARHVLCWPAFPLVPALRSTGSAALAPVDASAVGCSALFAGFSATLARSDFSCPCIIGYGSSPSRCGPPYLAHTRQRRPDRKSTRLNSSHLGSSYAVVSARRQHLAWRCRTCCLRVNENYRPLRRLILRGSIPHPTQSLCTLRNHRRQWPRNTRYQAGDRKSVV